MSEPHGPGDDVALLRLDPDIVMLEAGEGQVRLRHIGRRWEATVGAQVALLVELFAVPRTVASAFQRLRPRMKNLTREQLDALVGELVQSSVLVPHRPEGVQLADSRGGMFGAPVLRLPEALRGDTADVVFVGVPYDVGTTNRAGARMAPGYLRRASGALFQYDAREASPSGMWDPVQGDWLLRGVRLADAGNLPGVVFDRNGQVFDDLQSVVATLAQGKRLPVILGGDHSISLPVIRGLADAHGRLGVVHFDAHNDLATLEPGEMRTQCHHGNFMSWVLADARVEAVVQIGVRQLEKQAPVTSPRLRVWPGHSATAASAEALLATMPADLPWHVTVDVDVLEPGLMGSTGTPLPNGLLHREMVQLLQLVARNRTVVGMDLVELIPGPTENEGLIASDLILRTIAAATAAR
jgi:agmatinase